MRLVAIVSGDYGELGMAAYFLRGLNSAPRPLVLVPAALAYAAAGIDGLDVRSYANAVEIRDALAEARPDFVLLASGYLLPLNSGLKLGAALRVLRAVCRLGVPVLTSDPFLGLPRNPLALDFRDLIDGGRDGRSAIAVSWRMVIRLILARLLLRRAWHVYPAPLERLHWRRPRRLSFSNLAAGATSDVEQAATPAWLFVLAKIDYEMHWRALGKNFVATVIARLTDGLASGRRVVLIAPEPLVAAARARLSSHAGFEARSMVPYPDYMRELASAEYAFFWNLYSFSVLSRVLARRPAFFFDEGHMVRVVPAIGQVGVEVFYGGWRPPLLPPDVALDRADLAARAREVTTQFGRLADGLGRCPSPQELLRRVSTGS